LEGLLVFLTLLAMAYAAGYFTRDYISRRRRAHARIWENYIEPEWPRPANSNQAPPMTHGDLGDMLARWEESAKAKRARRSRRK
jgi:hypothetical protein